MRYLIDLLLAALLVAALLPSCSNTQREEDAAPAEIVPQELPSERLVREKREANARAKAAQDAENALIRDDNRERNRQSKIASLERLLRELPEQEEACWEEVRTKNGKLDCTSYRERIRKAREELRELENR